VTTGTETRPIVLYLWMLLVPLFWGGAFGAAKHIITEIPPMTAAALRFGLAGLILLLVTIGCGEWKPAALKAHWRGLMLMALTGIFAYNAFFFLALARTSAINGSLIMATTPVFVTLGAAFFLGEAWNRRLGFGLLLSLTGVVLVILQGAPNTVMPQSVNAGDLLFIAALFSWVAHGLISKGVMRGVSPLLVTTATTLAGSVLLAACSVWEGSWSRVPAMSAQAWTEMAYVTVCATVIAFFLWNKGVQQMGAAKASMYMNLVPINAAWIAVLFYGAPMTWAQLAGMAMVIAGVYVVTFGGRREKTEHPVGRSADS
jgi:drug/metabolite transporter (DMT)-like permease